jgi:hypothetical protein
VYLGSRELGVTPILGAQLPAGTHELRAVSPDGRTRTLQVEVVADESARYRIAW